MEFLLGDIEEGSEEARACVVDPDRDRAQRRLKLNGCPFQRGRVSDIRRGDGYDTALTPDLPGGCLQPFRPTRMSRQ
jgi:hypothetical protein